MRKVKFNVFKTFKNNKTKKSSVKLLDWNRIELLNKHKIKLNKNIKDKNVM